MTDIKSEKVIINRNAEYVFKFLSDFNNFEKLMPEQVINWKTTEDRCSFTIKGMADLSLKISERTYCSKIVWSSEGNSPFDFSLSSLLEDKNENQSEAQIILNADLSPMLKMMALRPLTNFVNILVNKLKEITENQEFS